MGATVEGRHYSYPVMVRSLVCFELPARLTCRMMEACFHPSRTWTFPVELASLSQLLSGSVLLLWTGLPTPPILSFAGLCLVNVSRVSHSIVPSKTLPERSACDGGEVEQCLCRGKEGDCSCRHSAHFRVLLLLSMQRPSRCSMIHCFW